MDIVSYAIGEAAASKPDRYQEGYEDGYSEGHTEGYTEGETAGYSSGYTAGEAAGYSSGYTAGETAGYNSGYTAGYDDGYAAGGGGGGGGGATLNPTYWVEKVSEGSTLYHTFTCSEEVDTATVNGSNHALFAELDAYDSTVVIVTSTDEVHSDINATLTVQTVNGNSVTIPIIIVVTV